MAMQKIAEKSEKRELLMPVIYWRDLDREAKKRSKKGKKVSAQSILRELVMEFTENGK